MLIGLLLLFAGVFLLIGTLNPDFGISWDIIWPSFLIIFSFYQILKNRIFDFANMIVFYIGAFFLLENLHIFHHSIVHLFFPIFLILIGGLVVLDRLFNSKKRTYKKGKNGLVEYNGIFTEIHEKIYEKKYKGAQITAIFGGVDLDLSEVESKDMTFEIVTIFGNSNLIFPEGYEIELHSFALFGGNENKYKNNGKKGKIVVNCTSIFGGVEVK